MCRDEQYHKCKISLDGIKLVWGRCFTFLYIIKLKHLPQNVLQDVSKNEAEHEMK